MAAQVELQGMEVYKKPPESVAISTPMDLLSIALQNNAAIDVIERLAALQEKAMNRDAEGQFIEAMNKAQADLGRVAPDLTNPQTHSKYASYAALDRVIRPIYTRHGFSLSFDCSDSPVPDTVRVLCYVSHRGGHTRTYSSPPMPADGKGAKGGDVMTKTHATAAAMSYGMRYLLKNIFNVAIGEDDSDGNGMDDLMERVEYIENARDLAELQSLFAMHYKAAKVAMDQNAMQAIIRAKDKRKRELQ